MTPQQAIIKVRDDIISWCTANFKKKADVVTTTEMQAKLDTLEVHPTHTSRSVDGAVNLAVDSQGHVTAASDGSYVRSIAPHTHTGGLTVGGFIEVTDGVTAVKYLYAPTISEMCSQENIVLTEGKQYGDTTPSNPVNGQLFFLRVQE